MAAITDDLPTTVYWEIQMEDFDGERWREVQTIRDDGLLNKMLDHWKEKWPERQIRVVEVTTTRKVHSA